MKKYIIASAILAILSVIIMMTPLHPVWAISCFITAIGSALWAGASYEDSLKVI